MIKLNYKPIIVLGAVAVLSGCIDSNTPYGRAAQVAGQAYHYGHCIEEARKKNPKLEGELLINEAEKFCENENLIGKISGGAGSTTAVGLTIYGLTNPGSNNKPNVGSSYRSSTDEVVNAGRTMGNATGN